MHPNLKFRQTTNEENIKFSRKRSFGILAVSTEQAPLMSHIPFQLSQDGRQLEAHLVRSNPIVPYLNNPVEAVMAVSGADAYISPDWYGVDNQVPTWNYVAIHIHGTLQRSDPRDLHGILDRLSNAMEDRLAPKSPWKIEKLNTDVYARLKQQIIPIIMNVKEIQGTWKLSQNKQPDMRQAAISGIEATPVGLACDEIVKLMGNIADPFSKT